MRWSDAQAFLNSEDHHSTNYEKWWSFPLSLPSDQSWMPLLRCCFNLAEVTGLSAEVKDEVLWAVSILLEVCQKRECSIWEEVDSGSIRAGTAGRERAGLITQLESVGLTCPLCPCMLLLTLMFNPHNLSAQMLAIQVSLTLFCFRETCKWNPSLVKSVVISPPTYPVTATGPGFQSVRA